MSDIKGKLYISTVSENAAEIARKNGLGLEIAEFCTAMNMDTDFAYWDGTVRSEMAGIARLTFHAPFNELCPAAIDPLIVEITQKRYEQAYKLMRGYGINTMIVHSGFVPLVYYPEWFVEKSGAFWKDFLADKPDDFKLCLENVLEQSPGLLLEIVKSVDDSRFRICLDVGHAIASGPEVHLGEWIWETAPRLAHIHLHNNDGIRDTHDELGSGKAQMAYFVREVLESAPDATFTIESLHCESSVSWLKSNGFLI